jgi:cytochrome P450
MFRCVAQNLANAELYLVLAAIVRRFDLRLFQTDYSDIECTYTVSPSCYHTGCKATSHTHRAT